MLSYEQAMAMAAEKAKAEQDFNAAVRKSTADFYANMAVPGNLRTQGQNEGYTKFYGDKPAAPVAAPAAKKVSAPAPAPVAKKAPAAAPAPKAAPAARVDSKTFAKQKAAEVKSRSPKAR